MKESVRIARSYIRSMAKEYGIEEDFYKTYDIHIHVPEGAIPRTAPQQESLLNSYDFCSYQNSARKNVAMTGEITLRGKVLPIGGLKEKVLAAHRAGVDTVIIPYDNNKDIEEIPKNARKIRIIPVAHIDDVIKHALVSKPLPSRTRTEEKQGDKQEESLLINHTTTAVDEAAATMEM